MSDKASFLIELTDGISGPVSSAQSALSKLEGQIKAETKTLKILEAQMKRLQGSQSIDIAEHKRLAGLIDGTKSKLAGLTNQYVGLAGQGGQAAEATGFLGQKLAALGGPTGIAIAVITALVAALAIVTVKLFEFAIAAADVKRSTLLAFEGLLGTAAAARDLDEAISSLRHHTAVTTDRLEDIGKTLAFAGLRGRELEKVLGALAKVEATVGQEGVNKFLKRIRAGEDYKKILDEINKKHLVDVGERQAAGFAIQLRDLKDDLADLFEDIDIEPFLAGLREVLMLFSDQTATGRALKEMITSIFSGLFKIISAVFPYIKAFIQGMVIGFLKVYIALRPIGRAIAEAFGGSPNAGLIDFFVFLGKAVAYVGVAIAALAIVFGAVWAAMSFVVGLIIGAPLAIAAAWFALLAGLSAIWDALVNVFSGSGQVAYDFVMGLANGIASGASAVVSAAIGVAKGAIDAVKGALGIQSPSKVMMEMGLHTAEGFAGGVDSGSNNAQSSMSSMVAAPAAAGGGASTTNTKSASVVVQLAPGAVVIQGGGGGGIEAHIDAAFTSLAERIALQIGAA